MADRDTQKEINEALAKKGATEAATPDANAIPKHEDLTESYEPNPNPDPVLKTRILVISLLKDGSGRFDIKSSGDMPGDISEPDIFSKVKDMTTISTASMTAGPVHPTMIDLKFKNPTKVVFYLNIPHWYFTAITGNNPMTFPFFIKADADGQRDQRSFEDFRGLDNLADITGEFADLKAIVVYNLFKHSKLKPLYFSHKFGLRMNYKDINSNGVPTVTPFELDPEVKNEG